MPSVVVFKSDLLSYSETFIAKQVANCRRWRAALIGVRPVDGGLPLEEFGVRYLRDSSVAARSRNLIRALRELEFVPGRWLDIFKSTNAKLVHVHFATELVMYWPLLRKTGLPILVTLHGADITTRPDWWSRPGAGWASRRYPQRLRDISQDPRVSFLAVSEAIKKSAVDFGIPSDKIEVSYIGVDTEYFKFSGLPLGQRSPVILFVGRMVEKKGFGYLMQAYSEIKKSVPDARLVAVGDGPLWDEYKENSERQGLNIDFRGRLTSAEVRGLMAEARVFCLPSVTAANGDAEGLPIVLLEAQACGVPCVTSAHGGAQEGIADGMTGYAFNERDVDAMAVHLKEILTSESVANEMSAAAVDFVRQRHSLTSCTERLEGVYDRVCLGLKP
jgi:glycosyltransferase involved in cell wall biosynthesis